MFKFLKILAFIAFLCFMPIFAWAEDDTEEEYYYDEYDDYD